MSDSEEEYDSADEEDEDEDSEGEDEEEEDEDEEEELDPEVKKAMVKDDIRLLVQCSQYADRVTRRLKTRLLSDAAAHRKRREADDLDNLAEQESQMPPAPPDWRNYEEMNDAERAGLLERCCHLFIPPPIIRVPNI